MVSLRSGKRTSRLSNEKQQAETPKLKRTAKRAAIFEDEQAEMSSEVVEEPIEKVVKETEATTDEDEIAEETEAATDDDEIVEETEDNSPQETVSNNIEEEEEEESDEDDEPMEITSKKEPSYDIKVTENPEPVASIYEQVMAKKAAKSAKDDEKRLKKRSKREARKIAQGIFRVKMKKNQASFKVVTLKRGVQQALEPANSFRDDLLKARTAKCRMQDSGLTVKRRDWVSK